MGMSKEEFMERYAKDKSSRDELLKEKEISGYLRERYWKHHKRKWKNGRKINMLKGEK